MSYNLENKLRPGIKLLEKSFQERETRAVNTFFYLSKFLAAHKRLPDHQLNQVASFMNAVLIEPGSAVTVKVDNKRTSPNFSLRNVEAENGDEGLRTNKTEIIIPRTIYELLQTKPLATLGAFINLSSQVQDIYQGRFQRIPRGPLVPRDVAQRALFIEAKFLKAVTAIESMNDSDGTEAAAGSTNPRKLTAFQKALLEELDTGKQDSGITEVTYSPPPLDTSSYRNRRREHIISFDQDHFREMLSRYKKGTVADVARTHKLIDMTPKLPTEISGIAIVKDGTNGRVKVDYRPRENDSERKYWIIHSLDSRYSQVDPEELREAMSIFNRNLPPVEPEQVVVGLAEGGITLAHALAAARGATFTVSTKTHREYDENRISFVDEHVDTRKEQNVYGLQEGNKVILIEDEISTAQTVINAVNAFRAKGIEVIGIASVVEVLDYGASDRIESETGLKLNSLIKIRIR